MDLFISAFMTFGSYLMISYFVYSLFGRNRKIPIAILSLLLFSSLLRLFNAIRDGFQLNVLMIIFMVYVFPVIAAFYVFLSISGGISFLRIKRSKKLKSISSDIQTSYFLTTIYSLLWIGSLLFGIGAYLFIEGYLKWVILSFASIIFIVSMVLLLRIRKVKIERVILIIGRDQRTFYEYVVPKRQMKVLVTDFFTNDNYIVDPIGDIRIENGIELIEKHYLYWIATNDKIDMTKETHLKNVKPVYENIISQFEKYHYRQMQITITENDVTVIKEKLVK